MTIFSFRLTSIFSILFICITSISSQKDIKSKLTKHHQQIQGTKVSLVPPKGFELSNNFNGFKHESSNSTLVVMNVPVSFKTSTSGIDKTLLERQGLKNITINNIKVNKLPGIYISGVQEAFGTKFNKIFLFFGNENESAILNVSYMVSHASYGEAMKKSMATVYLDTKTAFDPFIDLDYTLSPGNLKMAKKTNSSVAFNIDGVIPTKSEDKTNIIVSKSRGQTIIDDRVLFSKERLTKYDAIKIDTILSINEIKVDGLPGVEIISRAKEKLSNAEIRFYQLMIFNDKNYYITIGSTNTSFDQNVALLSAIGKTFKRKKQ